LEILTDPFLSDSAGGIRRALPPPKQAQEISPNLVLISHAHYDHLDVKTLKELKGEFPVITPKGCGRFVKSREVVELKDFEEFNYPGIKVTKVPAYHNRGRNLLYPDTEVGGFVFEIEGVTFYFAGDTAFSENLYSLIKEKFKVDVALLPIGGFLPYPLRKFHQTPEEAVKGFKILQANLLIPIHFGTWHIFPICLKAEKALERLLTYSYICNLRDKVLAIPPAEYKMVELEKLIRLE